MLSNLFIAIGDFIASVADLSGSNTLDARIQARVRAENLVRVRPMRNDPARAKFVDLIMAGENWPDEYIEFNIDPSATYTCEHLRPVEQRLRKEGFLMRLQPPHSLSAECLVNPETLAREFDLPPWVRYSEMEFKDRSIHDPDIAFIICTHDSCTSAIQVVHADSAKPDTPWFPR